MKERKSYKLINKETNKIMKYQGELQYFRTKVTALSEKRKIEKYLKIKLDIVKLK